MGYAEKRGDYYRGRYKVSPGKYGTVADANGETIRFRTKREATKAANDEESRARARVHPQQGKKITFGAYASRWYASQQTELATSTLQNYRNHIESHLLPSFEGTLLTDIDRGAVDAWTAAERASGYSRNSVQTYRSILHLILGDAMEEGLVTANPASVRRGRGRRTGRSRARGQEKIVTDPLGALLIAERVAALTGRDGDFVQTVTIAYTGMRFGEITGLARAFVRPGAIRVEQQLYELGYNRWEQGPPKDDSRRTIDIPRFLDQLLSEHIARTPPQPCVCHGMPVVFRSPRLEGGLRVPRTIIAQEAGVSTATISRALRRPEVVSASTRARVQAALERLNVISEPTGNQLTHWDRDDFRREAFTPAASGWYPQRGTREPARPVCLRADPWPGTVIRGRWSAAQAEACWTPVATGLTPHGLRHCHRTWMEDIGTRRVLMDERMGHLDGSVSARYAHVTPGMRTRLLAGLTELWEDALSARLELCPRSPVAVLDRLLQEHAQKIISPDSPNSLPDRNLRWFDQQRSRVAS